MESLLRGLGGHSSLSQGTLCSGLLLVHADKARRLGHHYSPGLSIDSGWRV
jgi:hypothetical protein